MVNRKAFAVEFYTTNAPSLKNVLPLENTQPEYHFDPRYGSMVEKVPEPYWKAAKQYPPTEIIQTALNRWFVESSNANGDGYVVERIYYAPQDKLRWICSCHDFLTRRQGTEHPYCKHIYHVYEAWNDRSKEHIWIRFPFPNQAVEYITQICKDNADLRILFWEDLEDLREYFLKTDLEMWKILHFSIPSKTPIVLHHTSEYVSHGFDTKKMTYSFRLSNGTVLP